MADLSWLPRESGIKDHFLWGEEHFSDKAPGVIFEKNQFSTPKEIRSMISIPPGSH